MTWFWIISHLNPIKERGLEGFCFLQYVGKQVGRTSKYEIGFSSKHEDVLIICEGKLTTGITHNEKTQQTIYSGNTSSNI